MCSWLAVSRTHHLGQVLFNSGCAFEYPGELSVVLLTWFLTRPGQSGSLGTGIWRQNFKNILREFYLQPGLSTTVPDSSHTHISISHPFLYNLTYLSQSFTAVPTFQRLSDLPKVQVSSKQWGWSWDLHLSKLISESFLPPTNFPVLMTG